MEKSYWLSRWQKNKIGFHNAEVNHYLVQFSDIFIHSETIAFVPLCGKSNDLIFLKERCKQVIGVEFVEKAILDFFDEQKLSYSIRSQHNFKIYTSGNLEIWCGSLFNIPNSLVQKCSFIYDRASIGAIKPNEREKYLNKISQASKNTTWMIHSFTYSQDDMNGPPFSFSEHELRSQIGEKWLLDCLFDEDVLQRYSRYKTRGLKKISEQVYKAIKI